jgi:hypothetical protein
VLPCKSHRLSADRRGYKAGRFTYCATERPLFASYMETLIISVLHPSNPPRSQPRTKDDDEEYEEDDDDETLNGYKPWPELSWPLRAAYSALDFFRISNSIGFQSRSIELKGLCRKSRIARFRAASFFCSRNRICIPQAQPTYFARYRDTQVLHETFDADSSARIVYRLLRQAGRLPLHLSQIPNIAYKISPHVSLKQVRCQFYC